MNLTLFGEASLIRRVSRGSEALRVGGAREDGRGEEKPGGDQASKWSAGLKDGRSREFMKSPVSLDILLVGCSKIGHFLPDICRALICFVLTIIES